MVLQSKTFAKRVTGGENAAPNKTESLSSRTFRTNFHRAANYRRQRNNGPKTTKYAVEQAKRRSIMKSPTNTIRLSYPIRSSVVPPVDDVEMRGTLPSTQTQTVSRSFPIYLSRPDFVEVPVAAVEAIQPELVKVDVSYIRDTLKMSTMGPSMFTVLRKSTVKDKDVLSKGTLPREVSIIVDDMASVMPTHMLAVHGPSESHGDSKDSKAKVTLFPVHSIIMAAHCANLPPFPPENEETEGKSSREIELPVRPLLLPSPKTFPFLLQYLYLRQPEGLLRYFLSTEVAVLFIDKLQHHDSLARMMATKFSTGGLLQHMTVVHGMWQNACSLGVYDDDLWRAIDFAWKVLLMSLAISTGKTDVLESIRAAETALGDEQEPEESSKSDEQESAPPSGSTATS
ncbi:hypothetical protein AN958_00537 [Leucoagaricus sp. SymC.cos]|nr:hypothetical protein AN958_00537 [Leucoagaricus sp. SymC.cos]